MAQTYRALLDSAKGDLENWFCNNYDGDDDESALQDEISSIADDHVPTYYSDLFDVLLDANLASATPETDVDHRNISADAIAKIVIYEELERDLGEYAWELRQEWEEKHNFDYDFSRDGELSYKLAAREFIELRDATRPPMAYTDLWLDFQLEIPLDTVSDSDLATAYFREMYDLVVEEGHVFHGVTKA